MSSFLAPPLVLASASIARGALLAGAGLTLQRDPADLDEDALKSMLRRERVDAGRAAMALAEAKALRTATRHAGALVIGADQMLVLGERWFDKPKSIEEARAHLLTLRARSHELVTAVCVVRDDAVLWRHLERPIVFMRAFSEAFLEAYLAASSEDVLTTVGSYRLEGLGAQLVSRIEGEYFSVLGLPLLPLLEFLRGAGAAAT